MLEKFLYAISFGLFSGFLLFAFNLEALLPIFGGIIVYIYKNINIKNSIFFASKRSIWYKIIIVLFIIGVVNYLFLYHIENIYVFEVFIFVFGISFFNKKIQIVIYSLILILLVIKPSISLYVLPFLPHFIQEYL